MKGTAVKITKKAVDGIPADPARDSLFWDDSLTGFGLRVSRGGVKSYIVQYRNAGGGGPAALPSAGMGG